jgi:hypothetical protein
VSYHDDNGGTHYDPVEANAICHAGCAIAEIKRLRAELNHASGEVPFVAGNLAHRIRVYRRTAMARIKEEAAARIEALTKLSGEWAGRCHTLRVEWAQTLAERDKAEARVAELEADAARYRWLRDNSAEQWEHPIVVSQTRHDRGVRYIGPVIGRALDAAIDAALARAAPTRGEGDR